MPTLEKLYYSLNHKPICMLLYEVISAKLKGVTHNAKTIVHN